MTVTARRLPLAVAALLALVLVGCDAVAGPTPPAVAQACTPLDLAGPDGRPVDISGAWSGNDGGVYYIKQIDSCVWWSGLSDFEGQVPGQEWVMTFRGTLGSDGVLHGEFVDVKGTNPGSGTMTIRIRAEEREGVVVTELHREASTGHTIGVTFWQRRTIEPTEPAEPTEPTEVPTPADTPLPSESPAGDETPPITLPPG
ncbi:MAG TPA: hypothetical protein VNT28_02745 [Candidatus Limnocylindrales bacterium]|nr:hypothetical protein [Candidatus Limnocylindrales bacterium]